MRLTASAFLAAMGLSAGILVYADEALASTATETSVGQSSATVENVGESGNQLQSFWMNYYGILLGPGVKSPSMYQPASDGSKNTDKPLLTKNFLTAGYNITDQYAVAVTGYWTWQPVQTHTTQLQDPSARFAFNSIYHTDEMNWYGDVRSYFPITSQSRQADLLVGFQTFHYVSYQPNLGPLTLGLYSAVRYNMFGKRGVGNDMELWIAPEGLYRLGASSFSLSLMYEVNVDHVFGNDAFHFTNNGNYIEPGVSWDVTPSLNVNPYFVMDAGSSIALKNTWFGMTLSWLMM